MISATCFSCCPILVVGNCVFSAVALPAPRKREASAMLFESTASAACASVTPLGASSRLVNALSLARLAGEELNPARASDWRGYGYRLCARAYPFERVTLTEKNAGKFDEFRF